MNKSVIQKNSFVPDAIDIIYFDVRAFPLYCADSTKSSILAIDLTSNTRLSITLCLEQTCAGVR